MDLYTRIKIIFGILSVVVAKRAFEKWNVKNKLKKLELKFNEETTVAEEEEELNLLQLPPEVLLHVASYLSFNKLKNFALVNKKCQQMRRIVMKIRLTKCVDLRNRFYVNEKKVLERVKNLPYKRVNLNQCYFLSPSFITELISRDSVRELDLTECNCTPEVIASVAKLYLTSLTISLSKTWREFFISKENESVSVLNGLNKLEIFHRYRSIFLMSQVSLYVLPHCHQLRSLKLFTPSSLLYSYEAESAQVFQFPELTPTPVPRLESLILDFHNDNDLSPHIKTFLDIILYRKTTPLTNIYLGKQTLQALFMGILNHNLISFDNANTLCVSPANAAESDPSDDNDKIKNCESVMESTRKCTTYKKISVENCSVVDCCNFIEMFVNFDETYFAELNLHGTGIERGICRLLNKISILNPGITFLDICIKDWSRILTSDPELSNSDLMKCLAKLINLRTLRIVPEMLNYNTSEVEDEENLKFLFREVTKKCKLLRNLQIDGLNESTCTSCIYGCIHKRINLDVFSCIKFFKNLRELSLINFCAYEQPAATSDLPNIIKNCFKLKRLRMKRVCYNVSGVEDILVQAKWIKHLNLDVNIKLTKTFVDNLSQCSRLEKLFLKLSPNEDVKMLKYFAQRLKKLNKLQFLSTTNIDNLRNECFKSVNKEIKRRRPRFFFDNFDDVRIPMAHHAFLQP